MRNIFTGMSAFPLTPMKNDLFDADSFVRLLKRLVIADVDSITVLGSTGSYAYLSTSERAEVIRVAVENSPDIPVFAGVGALRTSDVITNAKNAKLAGADAVLLAVLTYQALSHDEVFTLYKCVSDAVEIPIILYDNPGTTHFNYSNDLYARICDLTNIASIKIPGVNLNPIDATKHINEIRSVIPKRITIGVSGDKFAASLLNTGCDIYYSVFGGLMPERALEISRLAHNGDCESALQASKNLQPLWDLFDIHGSIRVVAAIAEELQLVSQNCLPLPVLGLDDYQRERVSQVIKHLGIS